MISFAGKTVLVTGASGGIGSACCESFAAEGARVILHYHRRKTRAEEIMKTLKGNGHIILGADLVDEAQSASLFREAVERTGRIDVLVNNAGIYKPCDIMQSDEEMWCHHWNETLRTNLMGPAMLCYHAARHMAEKGGGSIVNVTSRGAFRGEPNAIAYGASKAALNSLSQSLARKMAPNNVFVFAVAPGFVETEMSEPYMAGAAGEEIRNQSPLMRVAKPAEVARAIMLLASEGNDFMTGSILDVNGASYLRS